MHMPKRIDLQNPELPRMATQHVGRGAIHRRGFSQGTQPKWKDLQQSSASEIIQCFQSQHSDDVVHANAIVTFSPKVFIPLTRACNDACAYCAFAQHPPDNASAFMSISEVLDIAHRGASFGCTEALFTLGDKPEHRYASVEAELAEQLGFGSTVEYLHACASAVLHKTGLLPHANPGVVSRSELRMLKEVTASQGMMLESGSQRLMEPGMPHHNCPDKEPSSRLQCIEDAGHEKVPFTTGLLVGIGESRSDRLADLEALAASHNRHGHIGELIIQNFVPHKGTPMANAEPCSLEELLWTVAAARFIMSPDVTIQVPPNLSPSSNGTQGLAWQSLLSAGVRDFGGISPVTKDYVNPSQRWPELNTLADACAQHGYSLVPRLPLYPHHARCADTWQHPQVAVQVRRLADSSFLSRSSDWFAGSAEDGAAHSVLSDHPSHGSCGAERVNVHRDGAIAPSTGALAKARSSNIEGILTRAVEHNIRLQESEIERLFAARGSEFEEVLAAADTLRSAVAGEDATFVINRNINYTNACTLQCKFCAFANGTRESLRGPSYLLDEGQVVEHVMEAKKRGASEVCMQGAIHPTFDGNSYLRYLKAVKHAVPSMHVHAFSPLEIWHGAETLGLSVRDYTGMLRDAGLGSLPGTAAEVLDDSVRKVLCPDKINTNQWLHVVDAAHREGLLSTSTIMFGHVSADSPRMWANHLNRLRDQQERTLGFTEFVPLPFCHQLAPAYLSGIARRGPTLHESILMHSVGRLALQHTIPNVQASWVKMGPQAASELLAVGANDLGGTIQKESITSAAGANFGQELSFDEMIRLSRSMGRRPVQRNTTYTSRTPL